MRIRSLVSLVTAAVVLSSGAVVARASAETKSGPPLIVMAGSASWLVFEQADPKTAFPMVNSVMVRSAHGEVMPLPHSGGELQWSASGNMVGALAFPAPNEPIDWWNLATGKRGTVNFTGHQTSIGLTPDGVAYRTPNYRIHRVHVDRERTTSFKGLPYEAFIVFTTPRGIVSETKNHGDWYQRLGATHRLTRIHVLHSPGYFSACYSADAHYLGCWRGYDDDDGLAAKSIELVPLDGRQPQINTTCPGEPALATDSLVWSTGNADDASCSDPGAPTLDLITYGSPVINATSIAVTGPTLRTYNAATAYGKAIFTGPHEDTIIAVDSEGNSETLYSSQATPG